MAGQNVARELLKALSGETEKLLSDQPSIYRYLAGGAATTNEASYCRQIHLPGGGSETLRWMGHADASARIKQEGRRAHERAEREYSAYGPQS